MKGVAIQKGRLGRLHGKGGYTKRAVKAKRAVRAVIQKGRLGQLYEKGG